MYSYLSVVLFVYVSVVLAQRADRRARQAFAGRLGALYRTRGEFWRLRVWAHEARGRGDVQAAARFGEQAAELVSRVTGESTALRRDYPRYASEIGWMAGVLDDELADMGHALTAAGVDGYERWMTGRGRPSVDSVLNPAPAIEDDALAGRIHMAVGAIVGAAGGFAAWMATYWNDVDARLSTMFFFMLIGGAALGYVARAARDQLWHGLVRGYWNRWWADPV